MVIGHAPPNLVVLQPAIWQFRHDDHLITHQEPSCRGIPRVEYTGGIQWSYHRFGMILSRYWFRRPAHLAADEPHCQELSWPVTRHQSARNYQCNTGDQPNALRVRHTPHT